MKILIFDTETSGLPSTFSNSPSPAQFITFPEIVQFAYVVYDTDIQEIVFDFTSLIRPPVDFVMSPGSFAIHGISKEVSLSRGIPLSEELLRFHHFCKEVDFIVGHNIQFDINMLLAYIFKFAKLTLDVAWTDFCRCETNPDSMEQKEPSNSHEKKEEDDKREEKKENIFMDELEEFGMIQKMKRVLDFFRSSKMKEKVFCTMMESIEVAKIPMKPTSYSRSTTSVKNKYKFPKLSELLLIFYPTCNVEFFQLHDALADSLISLICFLNLFSQLHPDKLELPTEKQLSKIWNRLAEI